jgi:hypothetical protein
LFDEKQARRFPCFHSSVNQIKTVLWKHSKTPKTFEQKGAKKERGEFCCQEKEPNIYTYIPQSEDEPDGRWQSSITTGNRLK